MTPKMDILSFLPSIIYQPYKQIILILIMYNNIINNDTHIKKNIYSTHKTLANISNGSHTSNLISTYINQNMHIKTY